MSYGPRYKPKPRSILEKPRPTTATGMRKLRNMDATKRAEDKATRDINRRLKKKGTR